MKILLQSNIWNEYGYTRFLNSIIDQHIVFQEVDLIPFTEEFQQEVNIEPTVIFGSNRFVNVCRAKGYPTFKSFEPIEDFYPKRFWINGNGEWVKWGDLKIETPKFIKPKTEKFFTGLVVEKQEDLEKVQLATSFIENEDDELIWVADPVRIVQEIRFFIIGGKIITASKYKDHGIVKHQEVFKEGIPFYAYMIAEMILEEGGNIDNAFVMDLGLTLHDDWRIVELNNLNSAGLYECNTDAIIRALQFL